MHRQKRNHFITNGTRILLLSAIQSVVIALQFRYHSSLSSLSLLPSSGTHKYTGKRLESYHCPLLIDLTNDNTMIVRVRSNLGTMKLSIDDNDAAMESTVRDAVVQECRQRQQGKTIKMYKHTQALSFDPAGLRPLRSSSSLRSQGIRHGTMIYCRLEEEEEKARPSIRNPEQHGNGSKMSGGKAKVTTKKEIDVIDLIDSSDEEGEGCGDNNINDNDDDRIQAVGKLKTPTTTTSFAASFRNKKHDIDEKKQSQSRKCRRFNSNHSNFQIASYNVWFGPPDEESKQVFPQKRMQGIVEGLQKVSRTKISDGNKNSPLLFVGLQELTPSLVQYLKPHFQNIGYTFCTQPLGFGAASYGIGIAVSKELKIIEQCFVPYTNTIQARGFLYVRTPRLLLVTTHLESWCGPQYTGATEREQQIIEVAHYCQKQLNSASNGIKLAVILGDLNWDDERKQKRSVPQNRNLLSILPEGWHDAGTQFDFTYDAKENPMLNGNLRRRLDRCIYITSQQKTQDYKSIGLKKVGEKAIPNLAWNKKNPYNGSVKAMPVAPSDHFGIMISFSNTE